MTAITGCAGQIVRHHLAARRADVARAEVGLFHLTTKAQLDRAEQAAIYASTCLARYGPLAAKGGETGWATWGKEAVNAVRRVG